MTIAFLLEVSPAGHAGHAQLREWLEDLRDPRIRLIPPDRSAPWTIVSTQDIDATALAALLPASCTLTITQLRRRFDIAADDLQELARLVTADPDNLVIGRAALERVAQRRRLELAILTKGTDPTYRATLRRILAPYAHQVQVIESGFTRQQLRALIGKRAGCIGLLRGHTRLAITQVSR